jgi:hypothetical protein
MESPVKYTKVEWRPAPAPASPLPQLSPRADRLLDIAYTDAALREGRGMRRNITGYLTAVSLLLCVATGVLWVTSYYGSGPPSLLAAGGYRWFNSRGQVALLHHRARIGAPGAWVMTTVHVSGDDGPRRDALLKGLVCDAAAPLDRAHPTSAIVLSRPYVSVPIAEGPRLSNGGGFGFRAAGLLLPVVGQGGSPSGSSWRRSPPVLWAVAAPHWFLCLVAGALPAAHAAAAIRRRGRRRNGRCAGCNYDLRASPERCPECGRDAA